MRILVTGAKGQLGNEIRRCLESMVAEIGPIPSDYEAAQVDYIDCLELDIADSAAVVKWFESHDPYDIVINCAAYTNVDGCEENCDLAKAVNANGPYNLALSAKTQDAKLVHVSTDYVFPGDASASRKESDLVGPKSVYGQTKLDGERLVAEACPNHFIVRTAWLYGYVGKNFVKTMMRLGGSRDSVTVVDDQLGNPTSANDLAYEILKIALTENYGTYHCTNEGTCSWADFAQAIMEGAGLKCEVKRCTSEEYRRMNPQSASRPAFSSLENAKLAATIGNEMRSWQDALEVYLKNLPEMGD